MTEKMCNSYLTDLSFSTAIYGRLVTPMDLKILLYKGGAAENYRTVFNKIASGKLGKPLKERFELIHAIHEEMNASLIAGGSQQTVKSNFSFIRIFIGYIDQSNFELSIHSGMAAYREWADHLYARVLRKEITANTAYTIAAKVSNILSPICGNGQSLLVTTRLLPSLTHKNSSAPDKQDLNHISALCHLLMDITNGLGVESIYGPLPVEIVLSNGSVLHEWSKLRKADDVKSLSSHYKGGKWVTKSVIATRSSHENDRSLRTRYPLTNLRLEAELLIFISQTGMNLAEAHQIKIAQFSYKSSIDGYQVREYKNRRKGEVLFEIFSEYRNHFERYLNWRKKIFNNTSDLLFPFIRYFGRALDTPPSFDRIKNICKTIDVPYYGPQQLRKTRINWMLRKSRDPDLTAEQAAHTKEVLHRIYEEANHQVFKAEIIQFWKKTDPTLQQIGPAPGPGICDGIPTAIPRMPPEAPNPDCIHPGGCLFCQNHRDIDSQDYVWSTASMKHLTGAILSGYRPIEKGVPDTGNHIEMVLEILSAKLKWFESSNERRKKWVSEAQERCAENSFHPHWQYLIESLET